MAHVGTGLAMCVIVVFRSKQSWSQINSNYWLEIPIGALLYSDAVRTHLAPARGVKCKLCRCDLGSPFMNYIHVIHSTDQP